MAKKVDIEVFCSPYVDWENLEQDDRTNIYRISEEDFESSYTISEDAEVIYKTANHQRGMDHTVVLEMVLNLGSDIAVGVLSAWLYDKLDDEHSRQIKIAGERIAIDKDRIQSKLEQIYRDE